MKKGKLLLIMIIFLPSIFFNSFAQTDDPPTCFSINLLSLNTSGVRCRCQFTLIYEIHLPKIGIGVDFHESTGHPEFNARTFSFPVESNNGEIPIYDAGGFDICIYDIDWDLDWNPFGWFDTVSFVPTGENICQFNNSNYDSKLIEYINELDLSIRITRAKELQTILYENLPMITSHYVHGIYALNSHVEKIDSKLLTVSEHNPELWKNSDNRIIYAVPWQIGNYSYSNFPTAYNYFLSPLQYHDGLWLKAIYGSLFRRSPDTHIYEPCLAENYTFSPDRKSITIDLKPGTMFSNGDLVTALDIKYTYDLLKTPALKLLYYSNPYVDEINSTEVLDNDTIVFRFNSEVSYLLPSYLNNIFKLLSFGIVEQSIVEPLVGSYGYGVFEEVPFTGNITDELVTSCGPFKLSSYDLDNSVVELIPNEFWYGEGPSLTNLTFKYVGGKDNAVSDLINGEIDIMDEGYYPSWRDFEYPGTGVNIVPLYAGAYSSSEIIINLKHPVMGTGELTPNGNAEAALNIRKAISHSIPRNTIVDEIFESLAYPGVTSMPRDCVGFNDELKPFEFNLTLAKEYMKKAGCVIPDEVEETGDLIVLLVILTSLAVVPLYRIKKRRMC